METCSSAMSSPHKQPLPQLQRFPICAPACVGGYTTWWLWHIIPPTWWWCICLQHRYDETILFKGLTEEQRIFNYCISGGRLVVENACSILPQRFLAFSTTQLLPGWSMHLPLHCDVRENSQPCRMLHLIKKMRTITSSLGYDDSKKNMHDIEQVVRHNRDTWAGKQLREFPLAVFQQCCLDLFFDMTVCFGLLCVFLNSWTCFRVYTYW